MLVINEFHNHASSIIRFQCAVKTHNHVKILLCMETAENWQKERHSPTKRKAVSINCQGIKNNNCIL